MVTNFHVVGREREAAVVFPLYDVKGELVTDVQKYLPRIKELAIKGEVIEVDKTCDLALIRVERVPERVAAVPLARHPAATGSVVYSVGGSGAEDNLLWRLTKGNVRGRVQRKVPADFGMVDCMILETDSAVNPGDSGGPVVNDRGEIGGSRLSLPHEPAGRCRREHRRCGSPQVRVAPLLNRPRLPIRRLPHPLHRKRHHPLLRNSLPRDRPPRSPRSSRNPNRPHRWRESQIR